MDTHSLQVVCPLAQDPAVLDLLVPTFKQPVKNEDAIIEVLKYSQKDMDAALAKAQEEVGEFFFFAKCNRCIPALSSRQWLNNGSFWHRLPLNYSHLQAVCK